MLSARAVLTVEYEKLHKSVLAMVREDAVCPTESLVKYFQGVERDG
jgi:hypothetical protein